MNKGTTIFIDTEDMEERYGEELYKEYLEKENKQLKEENEKLNHYKLLYQKVKERNDKAIEYIDDNVAVYAFNNKDLPHWEFNDDDIEMLLEILKGNNETKE